MSRFLLDIFAVAKRLLTFLKQNAFPQNSTSN